ncbi:hypothetical protein Dda_7660 [Drechslerella dactyloides]|uniref:Protein kinase domain-containing protein n=1 Tax=Drechslerella dactyloides TaxID=74499 RepID=A0AAD6IT35_DREDA|nr:hypothetical protein Dda_7660 [Drechslerella dactyloides]
MARREEAVRSQLRQPLPPLTTIPGARFVHPNTRRDRVDQRFLFEWSKFEDDVNAFFSQVALDGLRVLLNDTAADHVIVGSDSGVSGRFYQHVGHVVGKAWACSEIDGLRNFRFHDAQIDRQFRHLWFQGEMGAPDFIVSLVDGADTSARIVGVLGTPWALSLEVGRDHLKVPMGQLAGYMRSLRLKYGVLSTYDYTVFVNRTDDYRFELSPALHHTAQRPSVRQCFFYLGHLASTSTYTFNESSDFDMDLLSMPASVARSMSQPSPFPADWQTSGGPTYEEGSRETVVSLVSKFSANSILYGREDTPTGVVECKRIVRKGDLGKLVLEGKWLGVDVIVKFWPDRIWDALWNRYGFERELDSYAELEGSRYIATLLDYGNVILANKLQNGRIIILKKEPGEAFSNKMWEDFSDREKRVFRQELVKAHNFLRSHDLQQGDPRKDNILWNRKDQTIKLLDFEFLLPVDEDEPLDQSEHCQVTNILDMNIWV